MEASESIARNQTQYKSNMNLGQGGGPPPDRNDTITPICTRFEETPHLYVTKCIFFKVKKSAFLNIAISHPSLNVTSVLIAAVKTSY